MTAQQIIDQCRAVALQQFPDGELYYKTYLIELYETKLRELYYVRPESTLKLAAMERAGEWGTSHFGRAEYVAEQQRKNMEMLQLVVSNLP